jgi:TRAP-type C4-dicarboxylate transport system permease small subunit
MTATDQVLEKTADEFTLHEEEVDLRAYGFEDWIALAIFWSLALVIFYQFFTRYALNDSASWTEEIARYQLIGVAFVGAAMNVRKNNHIHVDFVYRLVPRAVGRVMSTLVDVLRIAFLGYCVWLTWLLITKIGSSRMAIVDLPMGIVYGTVMFGFALMTVRAVQVAAGNWKRGYSVLERPEMADGTLSPALPQGGGSASPPPLGGGGGRVES